MKDREPNKPGSNESERVLDELSQAISAEIDGELTEHERTRLSQGLRVAESALADERKRFELVGTSLRELIGEHARAISTTEIWAGIQAEIEAECAGQRAKYKDSAAILDAVVRPGAATKLKTLLASLTERLNGRTLIPVAAAACAVLAIVMVRSRMDNQFNLSSQREFAANTQPAQAGDTGIGSRGGQSGNAENSGARRPAARALDVTFVGLDSVRSDSVGLDRASTSSAHEQEFPGQISGGPFEIVDEDADQFSSPRELRSGDSTGQNRLQSVFTGRSGELHVFGRSTPWDRRSTALRVGGVDIDWVRGAGPVRIMPSSRRNSPPVIWVGRMGSSSEEKSQGPNG